MLFPLYQSLPEGNGHITSQSLPGQLRSAQDAVHLVITGPWASEALNLTLCLISPALDLTSLVLDSQVDSPFAHHSVCLSRSEPSIRHPLLMPLQCFTGQPRTASRSHCKLLRSRMTLPGTLSLTPPLGCAHTPPPNSRTREVQVPQALTLSSGKCRVG